MINIKLGQLYGFNNQEELLQCMENMKLIGFSDEEINQMLEESKQKERN